MKIGLIGSNGRMCREIKALLDLESDSVLEYYRGCSVPMSEVFKNSEVVIDFSSPDALNMAIDNADIYKTPLLSGTTGIDESILNKMSNVASRTKILWTSNTSLGIYVTRRLSFIATKMLTDEYDIDVIETHHTKKKDNPSGTAITIANDIKDALEKETKINLNPSQMREQNEIHVHGIRRGDVFGEHSVIFSGDMDSIEIKHTAFNRRIFASSAIKIAKKMLQTEHPNRLMTIDDIYTL